MVYLAKHIVHIAINQFRYSKWRRKIKVYLDSMYYFHTLRHHLEIMIRKYRYLHLSTNLKKAKRGIWRAKTRNGPRDGTSN